MRMLGIDYGRTRVGIAISDPLNIVARGLTVLRNSPALIGEICGLITLHEVGTAVVGIPLRGGGERGEMAREVEVFAARLAAASGITVVTEDESFTSRRAGRTMIEMGVPRKKRRDRSRVDLIASALILQQYLDATGPGKAGGPDDSENTTPSQRT